MIDMKCPFCQQELVEIQFGEQRYWTCINDKCSESVGFGGNLKLWQELIRTHKALDVAVDALKELRPTEKKGCYLVPTVFTTQRIIDEALEQITALKQKDK